MKRSRINKVSKRKRREIAARAKLRPQVIDRAGGLCEIDGCSNLGTDMHEILTRARGGSATDPVNILLVCRACHRWIHEHPAEALRLGYLAR